MRTSRARPNDVVGPDQSSGIALIATALVAVTLPTLIAFNVPPSATFFNQAAAFVGWGGFLLVLGTLLPSDTWPRSRGATALLVAMALLSSLLITGCLGNPGRPGSGTPTIAERASVTPTLSGAAPALLIVDPPFDGGVAAGNVTVSVQVTGFTTVPPGGPNRESTGHLVYYRDVTPRTVQGETALTEPGTCAVSMQTAYTWTGIAPGTHTFTVQLVNADSTPLDPPAIDAVDVTAVSSGMIGTP
jgi:hypothetical protein